MQFRKHSHLNGEAVILANQIVAELWHEIESAIHSISDEELVEHFQNDSRHAKSISDAINTRLDIKLVELGWTRQSRIFRDQDTYTGTTWTLDFSKGSITNNNRKIGIAIEVVFNHGEAIAWNLIKLSLASENNFVRKETDIGDGVGVYVCATNELKIAGGFDSAVGEYEKVLKYLDPLNAKLIRPMIIVGLEAPKTFKIEHYKDPTNSKKVLGRVVRI